MDITKLRHSFVSAQNDRAVIEIVGRDRDSYPYVSFDLFYDSKKLDEDELYDLLDDKRVVLKQSKGDPLDLGDVEVELRWGDYLQATIYVEPNKVDLYEFDLYVDDVKIEAVNDAITVGYKLTQELLTEPHPMEYMELDVDRTVAVLSENKLQPDGEGFIKLFVAPNFRYIDRDINAELYFGSLSIEAYLFEDGIYKPSNLKIDIYERDEDLQLLVAYIKSDTVFEGEVHFFLSDKYDFIKRIPLENSYITCVDASEEIRYTTSDSLVLWDDEAPSSIDVDIRKYQAEDYYKEIEQDEVKENHKLVLNTDPEVVILANNVFWFGPKFDIPVTGDKLVFDYYHKDELKLANAITVMKTPESAPVIEGYVPDKVLENIRVSFISNYHIVNTGDTFPVAYELVDLTDTDYFAWPEVYNGLTVELEDNDNALESTISMRDYRSVTYVKAKQPFEGKSLKFRYTDQFRSLVIEPTNSIVIDSLVLDESDPEGNNNRYNYTEAKVKVENLSINEALDNAPHSMEMYVSEDIYITNEVKYVEDVGYVETGNKVGYNQLFFRILDKNGEVISLEDGEIEEIVTEHIDDPDSTLFVSGLNPINDDGDEYTLFRIGDNFTIVDGTTSNFKIEIRGSEFEVNVNYANVIRSNEGAVMKVEGGTPKSMTIEAGDTFFISLEYFDGNRIPMAPFISPDNTIIVEGDGEDYFRYNTDTNLVHDSKVIVSLASMKDTPEGTYNLLVSVPKPTTEYSEGETDTMDVVVKVLRHDDPLVLESEKEDQFTEIRQIGQSRHYVDGELLETDENLGLRMGMFLVNKDNGRVSGRLVSGEYYYDDWIDAYTFADVDRIFEVDFSDGTESTILSRPMFSLASEVEVYRNTVVSSRDITFKKGGLVTVKLYPLEHGIRTKEHYEVDLYIPAEIIESLMVDISNSKITVNKGKIVADGVDTAILEVVPLYDENSLIDSGYDIDSTSLNVVGLKPEQHITVIRKDRKDPLGTIKPIDSDDPTIYRFEITSDIPGVDELTFRIVEPEEGFKPEKKH